ncbi:MAG: potassium channel protein [Cyanobacteria bacterium RI_101]|nr:potassium channel protein [Cyanobacteria bacterium RI_101]
MASYIDQQSKRLRQELISGALALISLFFLGMIWYRLVEGWTWVDSAYMTAITLSTVGFGETYPLQTKSRVFTMLLILMGFITAGYMVNRFTEAFVQGYFQEGLRRRQERRMIERLTRHYILCGYGRTGRQIAQEFQAEGIPFVILEADGEQVQLAKGKGYPVLLGDATLDETLLAAKIGEALCIVAALSSDAENLYTVLSAKTLNPNIRAISRASTEEAVQKLQRAGADEVVSPYITGGKRLAAAALRPQVLDFLDGILSGGERPVYLEEFQISQDTCPLIGQTLKQAHLRGQSGALVLAIRRADRTLLVGPTGETRLLDQDTLICLGAADQLRHLNELLCPLGLNNQIQPPKEVR